MVLLTTQKELREVQDLPFCYLCGNGFVEGDEKDRDHVPPQSAIAKCDREPLWLPTMSAAMDCIILTTKKLDN